MKKIFFLTNFLVLLLFSGSFAQEKSNYQLKRVALIHKAAFEDSQKGIEKLAKAYAVIDRNECFPPQSSEFIQISNDLKNSDLTPEIREKKEIRLKNLQDELREISIDRFHKLEKLLVEPIKLEISKSLDRFEIENNLLVFDGTELEEKGLLLAFDRRLDVTKPFIAYFNNKSSNLNETVEFEIPPTKIAVINTALFANENDGIKNYARKLKEFDAEMKKFLSADPSEAEKKTWSKKCRADDNFGKVMIAILAKIQNYADEKRFALILDSSKKLPVELENFQTQDITKEFISYYNQLNP